MSALQLPSRVLRRVARDGAIQVARDGATQVARGGASRLDPRRQIAGSLPPLALAPDPARHPVLLTIASLVVLGMAVFGAVTFNALAADEAVRARELDASLRTAESSYSQLLAEVAALESPARIAAAAEELGLVRVEHPRQLHVQRLLPADGAAHVTPGPGDRTDRLKPLLADE